jgi:8-oxo-dGTP pyrophosphatase MutT (NUDIX family)
MLKAVGCIIYSSLTKRFCFQLRSNQVKYPLTWGFWGGKAEKQEKSTETLFRELSEELGLIPQIIDTLLLDVYKKQNKFEYRSYCVIVRNEFCPHTNIESSGFAWVNSNNYPEPMHNNARLILNKKHVIKKINYINKHYTMENVLRMLAKRINQ